jgi:Ca2+-binding RTX toxin-like protein
VPTLTRVNYTSSIVNHYSSLLSHTLVGTGGDDNLHGGFGDDHLYGGDGNDNLWGGDGSDSISGGNGNDHLYGENGNDVLHGDDGNDFLSGGAGNDTLYGGNGDDTLWGDNGVQSGSDVLFGEGGNDFLFGGASNDLLFGGDGNDRLLGDSGNDLLVGGNGFDMIWGGAGADTIIESGTGNDEIRLYQGDSLALTGAADTIITGDDWMADRSGYSHFAGIVVNDDVVGAGQPTGYTNATSIEGAAAEASSQVAHWYAGVANDPSYAGDRPETHAIYLYNAAQNQGYLVADLDHNGSYETGIVFTGLSIEAFQAHYELVPESLA